MSIEAPHAYLRESKNPTAPRRQVGRPRKSNALNQAVKQVTVLSFLHNS